MFASYRRLFALPGALAFTAAGLSARLSMSMSGVSLIVLVAERRGSYALAGAVSAAGLIAVAVGMPLLGRLVDRYGQARVAVPAVLVSAVPLTGLLLCTRGGAPTWTLFVCWTAACVVPNVGGMVRARWAHLLAGDDAGRHLANSFEQALDELCFTAGPVLGALLCGSLFPEAGLMASGLLCGAGVLALACLRGTEPPPAPPQPAGRGGTRGPDGPGRPGRGLWALLPVFLATGVVFGSVDVTTLAYATADGRHAWTGLLLGLMAAGSGVSGLAFGLVRPRGTAASRLLAGLVAMTGLLLLLPAAGLSGAGSAVLAVALFTAGSATAPTMISGMALAQELSPPGRLNQAMAAAVSAIMVGVSAGSALGGVIAQRAGPGTGYLVPAGAAATALLVAAAGRRRLQTAPAATETAAAAAATEEPAAR